MKIGWAKEHLDQLDAEVTAFRSSEPYTITKQDNIENQRYIVRFEMKPLDERIALLLADFIYALRSGLDQLAWQLALLTSTSPSSNTCFPIHSDNTTRSRRRFERATANIPTNAAAVIESLQPYHRGAAFKGHPLWQLNRLSNIDKHAIFAMNSTSLDMFIAPRTGTRRELNYGFEVTFPLSAKNDVVLKPGVPELIFGEPINSPGTPFEIGYGGIAEIYNFIERGVFPRFARFFPKPPDV